MKKCITEFKTGFLFWKKTYRVGQIITGAELQKLPSKYHGNFDDVFQKDQIKSKPRPLYHGVARNEYKKKAEGGFSAAVEPSTYDGERNDDTIEVYSYPFFPSFNGGSGGGAGATGEWEGNGSPTSDDNSGDSSDAGDSGDSGGGDSGGDGGGE